MKVNLLNLSIQVQRILSELLKKKDTPEKESQILSTMTEQISTRHYFTMNYVI